MLRPVSAEGLAEVRENELQRFKVSPPPTDHLLHQSSTLMLPFPSWGMTILRAHSARPSAGCFEDDKRKGNSVTRGDKFASSWVESFFQLPRCTERRRTSFIVTRNLSKHTVSSLSPLETRRRFVAFVNFFYAIADYPDGMQMSDRSAQATHVGGKDIYCQV